MMIRLEDVTKFYRVNRRKQVVLDRVTAAFTKGFSYGLLGVNGAGKSTTMRLLAGTDLPNAGRVTRHVRVSWPLGFAGGFHPQMSGRDNLRFVARIYGQDLRRVTDFVDDFSELGDAIDAPVQTYSSGMGARLAFALSMAIDFDCYLIDEITAVGDARFQARCVEAFEKRRAGADLIVISHSMATIKQYCSRGAVLVDGRLTMFDDVDDAIDLYYRMNR